MTNMASFGIIVLCLVSYLITEARCAAFVTVKCNPSEIIAQYGTNTILDCHIETQKHITDTKIDTVTWRLNNNLKLVYHEREFKQMEKGFRFAESNWSDTNMNVSLLITNTDLSHTGEYECSVGTSNGGDEAKVHLTVKANYSKPKIWSFPEQINSEKDFSLTCETHGGFPKGDLRWLVDGHSWRGKPEEELRVEDTGLLNLSSKLTFKSDSLFKTFVCEVYNANGVKEGEDTFNNPIYDPMKDTEPQKISQTQIVAPVVVIGSLIVGLLLLLLFYRRKQRRARRPSTAPLMSDQRGDPPDYSECEAGEQEEALNLENIA